MSGEDMIPDDDWYLPDDEFEHHLQIEAVYRRKRFSDDTGFYLQFPKPLPQKAGQP